MNLAPAVELKILDERLNAWGLPRHQSDMAAAVDLFACIDEPLILEPNSKAILVSSGFSMHINDPHIAAIIIPRSGLGHKSGLVLGNSVGLIDPDYLGTVFISLWNRSDVSITIQPGDRIAQMTFVPIVRPTFTVVNEFTIDTQRGERGFGSTGL